MTDCEGVYYVKHHCDGEVLDVKRFESYELAIEYAKRHKSHGPKCTAQVRLEIREYERRKFTRITTWKETL